MERHALSDFCSKEHDSFQRKRKISKPLGQPRHQKIHCQRTGNLKPGGKEISMIFEKSPDNYIDTEGWTLLFILVMNSIPAQHILWNSAALKYPLSIVTRSPFFKSMSSMVLFSCSFALVMKKYVGHSSPILYWTWTFIPAEKYAALRHLKNYNKRRKRSLVHCQRQY